MRLGRPKAKNRIAAMRLPGAMRQDSILAPGQGRVAVTARGLIQPPKWRSRVAAILSIRPVQYGGNKLRSALQVS